MRRAFILAYLALAALVMLPAKPAFAQFGGGGGGGGPGAHGGQASSDDDADQKKKDDEWSEGRQLDLPGKKNSGPCPYVKVLYDAARYQEFKDNRVASDAVQYTGEIQDLASGCEYTGTNPIHVVVDLLFALGRGPAASGNSKDYTYWVAVTDRNNAVLDKEYFTLHAVFPPGQDRVTMTDQVAGIMIPRANAGVSGGNFEVLVGFDVTPEMADFNRLGKRFRVNAGAPAAGQ